ncbi:MAG: ClbS/DfsB family four-helix bundle protein [Pseudomonadota bacterium]
MRLPDSSNAIGTVRERTIAATSKKELLEISEKEFAKLSVLIDELNAVQAIKKHSEDTSIKDVVGHRAHWITLFLGWYWDGVAGKDVYFPAKGYKWNQLKEYNRSLRAKQAKLSWKDAKNLLRTKHDELLKFIAQHSDEDLYGGPMQGANNQWTPGRWAEAAGPSHYRSAVKFIRQCLKSAG